MRTSFLISFLAVLWASSRLAAAEVPPITDHLYVLSFNAWGELENPAERELAIEELRQEPDIERIFIFSYGWANDGRASYGTYRRLLESMSANMPVGLRPRKVAVIAVAWDSSQSGFRKLFTDLIPLPGIGEGIAWLPDKALFPISFWSKAAQADRIGYGGLRRALNDIFAVYEGQPKHPEIYLVGHSFGTRIVSALMISGKGRLQPGASTFKAADYVRGAALLQPALVARNLDRAADYPIMVTMSRHDHAVGFLYPIANIPLNAFGFTLFEALIQRNLLVPMQQTVEQTVGVTTNLVQQVVPVQFPGILRPAPPPNEEFGPPSEEPPHPAENSKARAQSSTSEETPEEAVPNMVAHASRHGRRTLGELLALPANLAFTLVATPIDYVWVQGRGLVTRPFSHIMDTLAQIPVAEIPVDGLSRLIRPDNPWGQRSKGFFTLGPIHDGMGRMVAPELLDRFETPVYSLAELAKLEKAPKGIFSVDASTIVRKGGFGIDMGNPLVDYTIGWVAPIGAHSDFTNKEVMALVSWMMNGTPVPLPGKDEPKAE